MIVYKERGVQMKKKTLFLVISLVFIMIIICTISNADMGPKPSIKIYLKNMIGEDYYVDLLTQDIRAYANEYENEPFAKYNIDGWYATSIREPLLWGDVEGNAEHMHSFSYFGVPVEFKIIVQKSNGELIVSRYIERTKFNAEYTFDVKTGLVTDYIVKSDSIMAYITSILYILLPLLITIVVEFYIAKKIMGEQDKLFIKLAGINIFTNLILQFALWYIPGMIHSFVVVSPKITLFVITFTMEGLIMFVEYNLLKKIFSSWTDGEAEKVALVCNTVTAIFTILNEINILETIFNFI